MMECQTFRCTAVQHEEISISSAYLFILPQEVCVVLLQAVADSRLPVVGCPVPHACEDLALPVDAITNPEPPTCDNLLVQIEQVKRHAIQDSIRELGAVNVSATPVTEEGDEVRSELILCHLLYGSTATVVRGNGLQGREQHNCRATELISKKGQRHVMSTGH